MLLNVDAGELPGEPPELARDAHVLHIACGGHAGDAASMRETIRRAARSSTRIGAHPSYPDREGFGRRAVDLPFDDLRASLTHQLIALATIANDEGASLVSLKAHGALYHAADANESLANLLADLATSITPVPLAIVGPPGGSLACVCASRGVAYLAEGFADRRYEADGSLRSRAKPGALLDTVEDAIAQARTLAATGRYATHCVHGDSQLALPMLRALREMFP
jgi:UPF0271 protein